MAFTIDWFFDKAPTDLKNKKWVMVRYTDPFKNTIIKIDKKEYLEDCLHKFILEFQDKNKLITKMNDKLTAMGKYKVNGNKFEYIKPKISLILNDIDSNCNLDTEKRIIFQEMLLNATSYEVKGNNLFIYYIIKKSNVEGIIEFELLQ